MTADDQLPTFLLLGSMKSGTTSLMRYLAAHPDVFCPERKEPNYFTVADNLGKPGGAQQGLAWYRSQFAEGASALARGEGSTPYTMATPGGDGPDDGTARAERIRELLPDVRLIYVMRHPVDRMESQYAHLLDLWRLDGQPVDEAVRTEAPFLDISRYGVQLQPYLEVFGRERLLLLQFEELVRDPASVVRRALAFIGVDPSVAPLGLGARHNERRSTGLPRSRGVALVANRARRLGVTRHIPIGLRGRLRGALTRTEATGEFELSTETRAWAWAELTDDLEPLRGLGAGWMLDDWLESEVRRTRGSGASPVG